MGRLKDAIMWLEDNGYDPINENLHLCPIKEPPALQFKLETTFNRNNSSWECVVRLIDSGYIATFVSLNKTLAVHAAAQYIEYQSTR